MHHGPGFGPGNVQQGGFNPGFGLKEGQAVYICANSKPNLCLDVNEGSKKDCAHIILFDYTGSKNQIWIRQGSCLVSKNSGKVLDIEGGEVDGKNVIQYKKNGSPNQQFQVIPNQLNPNIVYIASPSGLALTVKDNNITKRAEIVVSKYNGSPNQRWLIKNA